MKRNLPVLATLATFTLFGGTISSAAQTQADRDRAVQYLEQTRAKVLEATQGNVGSTVELQASA